MAVARDNSTARATKSGNNHAVGALPLAAGKSRATAFNRGDGSMVGSAAQASNGSTADAYNFGGTGGSARARADNGGRLTAVVFGDASNATRADQRRQPGFRGGTAGWHGERHGHGHELPWGGVGILDGRRPPLIERSSNSLDGSHGLRMLCGAAPSSFTGAATEPERKAHQTDARDRLTRSHAGAAGSTARGAKPADPPSRNTICCAPRQGRH